MTVSIVQGFLELFAYWVLLYVLMGTKVLDLALRLSETAANR